MERINLQDFNHNELESNWNISTGNKVKVYTPTGRPVWVDGADIPYNLSKNFLASSESEILNTDKLKTYFTNFQPDTKFGEILVSLKFDNVDTFTELYQKTINSSLSDYINSIKLSVYEENSINSDKEEAPTESNIITEKEPEQPSEELPKTDTEKTDQQNEVPPVDEPVDKNEDIYQSKLYLNQIKNGIRSVYYVVDNDTRYVFVWDFINDDGKYVMIYTGDTIDIFKDVALKTVFKNLYEFIQPKTYNGIICIHTLDTEQEGKNKNAFLYALLGFDYSTTKQKFALASQYLLLSEKTFKKDLDEATISSMPEIAKLIHKPSKDEKFDIPKSYFLKDGSILIGKYLLDNVSCDIQEFDMLSKQKQKYLSNFLNNKVNKLQQLKYIGDINEK